MEDLFRFIMTRPAQKAASETPSVPVTPNTDYHGQLRQAKAEGLDVVRRVAMAKANASSTARSASDTKFGDGALKFAAAAAEVDKPTLDSLKRLVKKHFNKSAGDLAADDSFRRDKERLNDAVVTNVILAEDRTLPTDVAATILRAFSMVERLAADDETIATKAGVDAALGSTLLLPGDVFPLTRSGTKTPTTSTPPPRPPRSKLEDLIASRDTLLTTYNMITRVTPEHLAEQRFAVSHATRLTPGTAAPPPAPHLERLEALERAADPHGATAEPPTGSASASDLQTPRETPRSMLILRRDALAAFPEAQRTVLAERGLDLTTTALPLAAERLSREIGELESQIAEAKTPAEMVVRLGNNYITLPVPHLPLPIESVPSTFGNVAPAGIGDLLVVRQFLKRYEAQELGHVENILKGEYKERMHRRARTTEETITVEVETKREEERDLQTTERFELKTEVSQTVKDDQSLKIGLSVSGSYGPMVEFKASTDFAMNHSKEESSKVATSYSKDVTQRATSKIFERRREERILKTIEQFEEKNTHGFDNKAGTDHVIGQYQWIDKVYEAQVFNYGKRLLFDIMLPEPAAFLLHAMSSQPKPGVNLVKPQPFTAKPSEINEWNYDGYIRQYEVVGVTPPPQPYMSAAKAVEGKGTKDDGTTKILEIPLPDGYEAISYQWLSKYTYWDDGTLEVVILPEPINQTVGATTLAVKSRKIEAFTVSIGIFCQRTQRALDDWKLKTHAAILQAYQKLARDYEDQLAAAEVQAAQQVQGRNPLENELLIRTEIKKGAISVFTAQHYDLFGAISSSSQGYPQPNLAEAAQEGKYIRFFEQAFEWEQMMFFFYPYFWGRKENWLQRALLQDTDPLFAEFIKAGSARVVVSVRPGFEQAVAHFLESGETWNGGDLPPITSPLYFSIIEEIKERDKAPGNDVAQGDPWDVHLPTTLVILRDKTSLPEWHKNASGEWVPV
jgi:hypothetical protein